MINVFNRDWEAMFIAGYGAENEQQITRMIQEAFFNMVFIKARQVAVRFFMTDGDLSPGKIYSLKDPDDGPAGYP
jgi:hypothetical protein